MIWVALYIAAWAAANRFAGGGFERPQGPLPDLPGRPVWYVGLIALVSLGWFAGWAGLAVALGYITYREPAWRALFGAELDWGKHPGGDNAARIDMFLRSFVFSLPAWIGLAFLITPWVLLHGLLFAVIATLGYEIGNQSQGRAVAEMKAEYGKNWQSLVKPDVLTRVQNTVMRWAEPIAGAGYGLMTSMVVLHG